MIFLNFRIYQSSIFCIFIIFIINLIQVYTGFVLIPLSITSNGQSFSVPYNKTLSNQPTGFAYFIQSGTIHAPQFYLKHNTTLTIVGRTQIDIMFHLEGLTFMSSIEKINVRVLITDYSEKYVILTLIQTKQMLEVSTELPVIYNQSAIIKQLQVIVFTLNIPMRYTKKLNSSHLLIRPTMIAGAGISLTRFSVLILTKLFLTDSAAMFSTKFWNSSQKLDLLVGNYISPTDQTTIVGIASYYFTSADPAFDLYFQATYLVERNQNIVSMLYQINNLTELVQFQTVTFIFGDNETACTTGILLYLKPYFNAPIACVACPTSCKDCTYAKNTALYSDQYSCLSCTQEYTYIQEEPEAGQCQCYPGLKKDFKTLKCIPCQQNCLEFSIYLMRSPSKPKFLLIFSSPSILEIPMKQNLNIYVNQRKVSSYNYSQMKTSLYSLILESNDLIPCNKRCIVTFEFSKPWRVIKKRMRQSLSQSNKTIQIENLYILQDKIPDTLNQAFAISGMLAGTSGAGGLSSLLKMLFQLEQMIQYHKYLNLELPIIFKEFIQSLNVFRFLDITAVIPFDIDAILINLLTDEQFDLKGPIKPIFYEYGINFYKNIMPVVLSFGIILFINFFIFLLFRFIPCRFFWRFSQKLRMRALITFCDLFEAMIVPIVVFANFQFIVIYYRVDIIWIYLMAIVMVFIVLFIPFFVITYIHRNKNNKQMISFYEDLLNDCQINKGTTFVFFLVAYYRKVFFALSLISLIPGIVQGYCALVINTTYFGFIIYVFSQKIFNSKLKMLTKAINALCLIGIEGIMLYYNYSILSLQIMVDLGASCVYLSIVATIAGLFEALIKLFQIVFQNVKDSKALKRANANLVEIHDSKGFRMKKEEETLQQFVAKIGMSDNSKQTITTASVDLLEKGATLSSVRAENSKKNSKKDKKISQSNQEPESKDQEDSFSQLMDRIDKDQSSILESINDLKSKRKEKPSQSANLKKKQINYFDPDSHIELIFEQQSDQENKKINQLKKQEKKTIDQQIKNIQLKIRSKIRSNKKHNSLVKTTTKTAQTQGKNISKEKNVQR